MYDDVGFLHSMHFSLRESAGLRKCIGVIMGSIWEVVTAGVERG
jgi:hypothetical protein